LDLDGEGEEVEGCEVRAGESEWPQKDGGITKLVVGVMVGGHYGMLPGPWGKFLSERDASRGTDKGDLRVEVESLGFVRRQGGGGTW
jgi:hypothetical protein